MTEHVNDGGDADSPVSLNADRWVRGGGRYLADIHLPRELTCAILRSPHPHAQIVRIDTSKAEELEGVRLVVTGAELSEEIVPHGYLWDLPGQKVGHGLCLTPDKARYVGDPVAAVVATDQYVAEDALDLITVQYDPLPPVNSAQEAMDPDAPLLHEHWGDNIQVRAQWPVPVADDSPPPNVDDALDSSTLLLHDTFTSSRIIGLPLETRGVIADCDATASNLTVYTSTQSIHQIREAIAASLRMPENQVRVIASDVGGAFGMKAVVYPEEILVSYLARRLRRPVRWIEQRDESFVASMPSRAQEVAIQIGFDSEGVMLGLRANTLTDLGASPSAAGAGTGWVTGALLCGPYRVPAVDITATAVVTNKSPLGAYRGYGQPEANFPMERLLDRAARELGIDAAELRRRNLVPSDSFPHPTSTGLMLDSGRYTELLDLTLQRSGYAELREYCEHARAAGRLVGLGLAYYNECTNFGPSGILPLIGVTQGGWDSTTVRVEPDGRIRVFTSQTPMGQGVETVLASTAADAFAVPMDHVTVCYGDTLSSPYTGYASGGSRAAGVAGSSLHAAADKVKVKLRQIAAHQLEADPEDVELVAGGYLVRGSGMEPLPLEALSAAAYRGAGLPDGLEPGLEAVGVFDPPSLAFSYGVVVALVEVDADDGTVRVDNLWIGHDCGPQLNPAIVAGQVVGGALQGLGAALYEELGYDEHAQPMVRSMTDYLLPTVKDMPEFTLLHLETPTPFSLNGAKGVGESGVIATPAAIVNAIQDALPSDVEELTTIPVTPLRLLRSLEESTVSPSKSQDTATHSA
ncbi:xanthine dehydrogenase, molybdenum binding subunit apoprotein [Haloechinothrix alba]|uniref:Xanthine dehydrogenase, molybdenum binding subunit apoprotein n=1 Tax=Haloechinothrix alba TaxID=664784 RepID=A0A239A1M1_9PSEU|nr:xanthine dehydrogenase family protein molybdopterin-binding subunit [Haloechinothrix alba]SNR88914.1 xanthine dehydrogenase, molybdenum binding subunit apoprotein [Haloechinothrix alba]